MAEKQHMPRTLLEEMREKEILQDASERMISAHYESFVDESDDYPRFVGSSPLTRLLREERAFQPEEDPDYD